jgi:CDP-diacylglycerol--glycerol-3-phosphate 3-phosphatidyltransferase
MSALSKLRFVTFLTFVRFPLVLVFFAGAIVYAEYRHTWIFVIAFASLILSAVTDLFDGYFARRFKVETKFGAHADPLMDKFFYLTSLPLLVFIATKNGHMNHAVFLLVLTLFFLARDQWVTFLRSIGSMYNVSGKANWSGKVRTCMNFPVICAIYFTEEAPVRLISQSTLYIFESMAFIINLISVFTYTRHYWPWLKKSISLRKTDRTSDAGTVPPP